MQQPSIQHSSQLTTVQTCEPSQQPTGQLPVNLYQHHLPSTNLSAVEPLIKPINSNYPNFFSTFAHSTVAAFVPALIPAIPTTIFIFSTQLLFYFLNTTSLLTERPLDRSPCPNLNKTNPYLTTIMISSSLRIQIPVATPPTTVSTLPPSSLHWTYNSHLWKTVHPNLPHFNHWNQLAEESSHVRSPQVHSSSTSITQLTSAHHSHLPSNTFKDNKNTTRALYWPIYLANLIYNQTILSYQLQFRNQPRRTSQRSPRFPSPQLLHFQLRTCYDQPEPTFHPTKHPTLATQL